MEIVNDFYIKAKSFCCFLEETSAFEQKHCRTLILFLLDLYRLALQLPDVDLTENSSVERNIPRLHVNFGMHETYWEVHDPREFDDPVCGSLSDDFSDIYQELMIGIQLFEKNLTEAVWHWKWSFENHWSYHTVDALRALNQILND